jgi:hypothetical protein
MKNIHILPTDNYSPLVYSTSKYGGLFLSKYYSPMKVMGDSYQNIYITSDKEIKEGDWFITNNNEIFKCIKNKEEQCFYSLNASILTKFCKKIILTTDQDLIKDGVQAIDDEFLEWFVKNSSCEEVELEVDLSKHNGQFQTKYGYKIIIPKEETKQETLENPVIIVRNDDKEEFIHLSNGMYGNKWGILNNSISSIPLEAFDKSKFTFYYEKRNT